MSESPQVLKVYYKNTATGEEGSEEFNTVRWACSYNMGVVMLSNNMGVVMLSNKVLVLNYC